ncbi:MAG TPA: GNAT family protein [Thermoleophilaceae bacterium]|nr:GNAT family protein [Thermoleophilaceae bacterium]
MRIEGDGWVLRPEREDDAAELARAFVEDPHLAVDWGIEEIPDEELASKWLGEHAALWEQGEGRHLAVADADTDALLGGVNFHHIEPGHHRAEVGFWLAPWARGRGIGSGAVGVACRWAFDHWGLVRIEMTTLPDNEASLALARKLGFRREGLLRSRNFERGNQVDIAILAVLVGDLAQ